MGIIAYLLLTGRLPFGGEDGQEVSDLFLTKQTFSNRVSYPSVLCATQCITAYLRLPRLPQSVRISSIGRTRIFVDIISTPCLLFFWIHHCC